MFQQIVLNGSSLYQSTNETCPEHDFWYTDKDPFTNTFVRKFDLVCSREYLRTLALSISGVGEVLGSLVYGYFIDRFGRKIMLFIGSLVIVVGNILTVMALNPYLTILGRFVSGTSTLNLYTISFVLALESFPPKQRSIMGSTTILFWTFGIFIVSPLAYLCQNSSLLILAVTFPIFMIIPGWWFLEESIHWNLSKGNIKQVKKQLKRIARFNKVSLDEHLVDEAVEEAGLLKATATEKQEHHDEIIEAYENDLKEEKANFSHLFRTPRLRAITISFAIIWMVNHLCYYGLQMAADRIPGTSIFVSYSIFALVEVPAVLLSIPILYKLGRKFCLVLFTSFTGICLITVAVIPQSMELVILSIASVGKFALSASCSEFLFLNCVELYF